MKKWKMKEGNTTHKRSTTMKTITKNKTYKITALIISLIFMCNLNAIVDYLFHPEIPYFDVEHIIVGCATGIFTIVFLIIAYFYFYYQWKLEEELFRTVLNNAPITIFATDSRGIFTLSEGKGLERAGLKPGDNVGVSAFDLYNFLPFVEKTGKVTNGKDVISRALAGESVIAFSLLFGVHFENHIGPLLDKEGNIAGIVGVATDITERKLAEEALRESEQKYRNLVENLGKEYFFYRHNRYGVFTYVSNSMTEMLGYSIQEFLTHHTEYHTDNPINKEAVRHTELSIQGQRQSPYEIEIYHKDRSIIWLEVTEIPLRDYNGEVHAIEGIAKNITERKLVEEELRILSSRQQAILASVPDIIMEVDDNKIYTWANAAGFEFFGDEVIGKEASLYFEGEQETYNIVKPLFIGSENIIYVESWQRRKDGKKRLLAWCCKVLKDENGKVTGALSSAQDITEHKLAEIQIQYQANLLENVSDATLATDRQFNIQYWNTAAEKQYGWTSAEVLGKHFTLFIKPNYLSESRKTVMQKILQNGYWSGELLHNRRDGTLFSVLATISEVKNTEGHVVGHIAINRDITERKKAEEKLLASEIRYRRLFESAKDGILILDAKTGNILDVNPFLAKLLGYSKEQLVEKDVWEIGFFENIVANQDKFFELQRKKYVRYENLPLETADGRKINVEFVSNVYLVNDQEVIQCNIRDITDRKKAEEEIKESKRQLEQLYKRLNDIRENERLEISREIHDELGQSLTALKMDLNWTKENLTDKMLVAKKFNSMIDIVSETIKKVQRISAALRPGMLDDLGLIPAVQWYGQEFEERTGLKCNFDLKELPSHNSQINLTLFRIFQEGLTNIIRHADAKSVDVKLYSSLGNIILKITDDGIGTEQEKIDSKESLGLLGMKERIKHFNGSLEIISSENKGTSLIVSIPIIN